MSQIYMTAKYKANCARVSCTCHPRGNAFKKLGESKMITGTHAHQTHEKIIIQNIWSSILDRIFGEVYCVCKCLCVRETCVCIYHTRTFSILLFSSAAWADDNAESSVDVSPDDAHGILNPMILVGMKPKTVLYTMKMFGVCACCGCGCVLMCVNVFAALVRKCMMTLKYET